MQQASKQLAVPARLRYVHLAALFMLAACGGGGGGSVTQAPTPAPAPAPAAQPGVLVGTVATGAAVANAEVAIVDDQGRSACAAEGSSLVTDAKGSFRCTLNGVTSGPLSLLAVDPRGLVRPMSSLLPTYPGDGQSATVNITPLTAAITAQLAPRRDPLAFATNPSNLATLDAQALAVINRKVAAQLAPMLREVSVPADTFDPLATPFEGGSNAGVDRLLDRLVVNYENGVPTISNALGAQLRSVPLADASATEPVQVAASVDLGFDVAQLDFLQTRSQACFSVSPAERGTHADCRSILVDDAPANLTGGARYLHSGGDAAARLGPLLNSAAMTGARFNRPELLRYIQEPDGRDRVVLNLKFATAAGYPDNQIFIAKRFPGSATASRPTDWWLFGNQQQVNFFVQPVIRLQEQLASQPSASTSGSRYLAGLTIFIAKPCPNPAVCPNTQGLRYARVTGPGLPDAGLVFGDATLPQTWMGLLNANGTVPTGPQVFSRTSINNFWLQQTAGLAGNSAAEILPNVGVGSATAPRTDWAHPAMYGEAPSATWSFDLTKVPAWSEYTFELFYDEETTPRRTVRTSILRPVVPAWTGANQQWHTLTDETRALATQGAPAATQLRMAWKDNPLADRIETVQVYTGAGSTQINSASTPVPPGASEATVTAVGGEFAPAQPGNFRFLQLRHNVLDGSYKDQAVSYN